MFKVALLFFKLGCFEKSLAFSFGVAAPDHAEQEKEGEYEWSCLVKKLQWVISM